MSTQNLFSTPIFKTNLSSFHKKIKKELLYEIMVLTKDDIAGQEWSSKNYPNGYTSYASANQMHRMSPTFSDLEKQIRKYVTKYIHSLQLNISKDEIKMDTCWVNKMNSGCTHSLHNHPRSVISGTYYLQVPKNSSVIRFEDPRYSMFMNRPPLKKTALPVQQTHYALTAKEGDLVLFESWLRHDVPVHLVKDSRISISFNY